jgi:hypothetical protein
LFWYYPQQSERIQNGRGKPNPLHGIYCWQDRKLGIKAQGSLRTRLLAKGIAADSSDSDIAVGALQPFSLPTSLARNSYQN